MVLSFTFGGANTFFAQIRMGNDFCRNVERRWSFYSEEKKLITLKVESFAGRNFRDFASFLGVRESLYPRDRTFIGVREILHEKSLKMASK